MRKIKNFSRQIDVVQNAAIPPRDFDETESRYEIFEYEVTEACDSVIVRRAYKPIGSKNSVTYRQCWIVGPRGGKKVVYDRIDI